MTLESFQMYSTHMYYHPDSIAVYRPKQEEQTLFYKKIVRDIDTVLQMDQVVCIWEGLPQVPSPRYIPTWDELKMIILDLSCNQPMEMQMSQTRKCK